MILNLNQALTCQCNLSEAAPLEREYFGTGGLSLGNMLVSFAQTIRCMEGTLHGVVFHFFVAVNRLCRRNLLTRTAEVATGVVTSDGMNKKFQAP